MLSTISLLGLYTYLMYDSQIIKYLNSPFIYFSIEDYQIKYIKILSFTIDTNYF